MTAYSTQGQRYAFKKQASGFGTAETTGLKDFRPEGQPTQKAPVKAAAQPNCLYANEHQNTKPIVYDTSHNDAMKIAWLLRQAAAADGESSTESIFESGGYTCTKAADDTTVAVYTSDTSFTATADKFGVGYGCNVELSDGRWWPIVCADYNTGNAIVPGMALPSATEASKALNAALTVTPGAAAEITGTNLLTIHTYVKALDGTDQEIIVNQDCAMVGLDDITIEPGGMLVLSATFGASSVTESAGASALSVNDFADYDGGVRHCDDVFCQFAAASAAGGIAAAYQNFLKATIKIPITAEPIPGMGSTSTVNGVQGWMKKVAPAEITLELLYDADKMDDWNGTNASRYIGLVRAGAAETDASWAFIAPNAHLTSMDATYAGNNEYRCTATYKTRPAGYNSTTATADQGNQPWYLIVGARG
jgi:hypothetical protein